MNNRTHLIYAGAEEVKAKLQYIKSRKLQLDKQREVLKECDDLQVVEINGELMAAVDIDVYQFLVRFLMDRTEEDHKDLT